MQTTTPFPTSGYDDYYGYDTTGTGTGAGGDDVTRIDQWTTSTQAPVVGKEMLPEYLT